MHLRSLSAVKLVASVSALSVRLLALGQKPERSGPTNSCPPACRADLYAGRDKEPRGGVRSGAKDQLALGGPRGTALHMGPADHSGSKVSASLRKSAAVGGKTRRQHPPRQLLGGSCGRGAQSLVRWQTGTTSPCRDAVKTHAAGVAGAIRRGWHEIAH